MIAPHYLITGDISIPGGDPTKYFARQNIKVRKIKAEKDPIVHNIEVPAGRTLTISNTASDTDSISIKVIGSGIEIHDN